MPSTPPSGDATREAGRRRSAVTWSALESGIRNGTQLLVTIVLARWIAPSDFGLFALVTVLVALAALVVDSGLGNALIRQRDRSAEDENAVFWFNTVVAVLILVAGGICGQSIAAFFSEPQLASLTWIAGLTVLAMALQMVPAAIASERLDFRSQAHAALLAVVVSGALAVWLARRGAGVWALAWQAFCSATLQTIVLWIKVAWRPAAQLRFASLRRLLGFGGYLLLSNVMDTLATRLHLVLIGRVYGSADLGQFFRASSTKDGPQGALGGMFSRVAFPIFAAESADPAALRIRFRNAVLAMMAVNLPVTAGLMLVADPLVRFVFGDAWMPSVPLLRILCIGGLLWPLQLANIQLLLAQGHSNLMFRMELVKKAFLVLMTIVMVRISMRAVAWGIVASAVVALAVNAYYSGRLIGYGCRSQVRDTLPYVVLTGVMCISVVIVNRALPDLPSHVRLIVLAGTGASVYVALLRASGLQGWLLIRSLLPVKRVTLRQNS